MTYELTHLTVAIAMKVDPPTNIIQIYVNGKKSDLLDVQSRIASLLTELSDERGMVYSEEFPLSNAKRMMALLCVRLLMKKL